MPLRGKIIVGKRFNCVNNEVRSRGYDPLDSCVAGNSTILDSGLDLISCLDSRISDDSSKTIVLKNDGSRGKIHQEIRENLI
jgi:hypothetical protein